MIERKYIASGEWDYYDFLINKYFWIKHGLDKAIGIRKKNLVDVVEILEKNNVIYWLQGKTLLGVFDNDCLIEDDHDDDLSIWIGQKELVISIFQTYLSNIGFKKIRENEHMISFERDFRYIDICFFRSYSSKIVGYGDKRFPAQYFKNLDTIKFEGISFNIPSNTSDLLKKMYPEYFGKIKREIFKFLSKLYAVLFSPQKILKKVSSKISYMMIRFPPFINILISPITQLLGIKYEELSLEDFLNLKVEPTDSFNWKWRARHLNIVTNEKKFIIVKDILAYLSSESVIKSIENSIEESELIIPFNIPSNLDMDFWWSGNNYFWYCIKYKFRKGVTPYADVNKYLLNKTNKYIPYSSDYYESLEKMNDDMIRSFLSISPIEITDNSVIGGKHRVFAMIGRLLDGESYIPFKVLKINM
jgi:hypothetical protein